MTLRDIVRRVVIDPGKLTEYALDPNHPTGRHKARVFERALGFTPSTYRGLIEQLQTKALVAEAILHHRDAHGDHYRVDLDVTGSGAQRATVRTGWLVSPGSEEAMLVTLYVRREG